MTRVLIALALSAFGVLPQSSQKPRERGPERLWIDAVFLDGKGNPVTDIRKDEIDVWIGHFQVPIDEFISVTPENDAGRGAHYIVLVLDDLTVPLDELSRVKDTARYFVSRMGPDDRMAIVTLDGSSTESTGDRARLQKAINDYYLHATSVLRPDVLGEQVLKVASEVAGQLAEAGDQRKTIVAIGRGSVFDRPIPPVTTGQDLMPEWVDAMRVMALANTNLYVIDSGSVGTRRLVDNGDTGFAKATGGHAFMGTNDLHAAADKILREASNYYLIGVKAPPVGRDADLRELTVKIKRHGVTVRRREAVSGGR